MNTQYSEDRAFIDELLLKTNGEKVTLTLESLDNRKIKVTGTNNRNSIKPHIINDQGVVYPFDRYAVIKFN